MPHPIIATGSTQDILRTLNIARQHDADVEQKLRSYKTMMIVAWISVAACFFMLVAGLPVVAIPFGIVFLIVAVYMTAQFKKYSDENIEDRRIFIPQRFFEVLGRDIPAKRRCSIHIDCAGYLKHGQLTRKNATSGFFAQSIKQTVYKDRWFVARGRLCDNTIFRVNIEQSVHRKEKAKRKYTKVTERIHEKVNLLLRIAPDAYPAWATLAQSLQPAAAGQLDITDIVVQNSTVRIVAATPPCRRVKGRYGTQASGEENLVTAETLLQLFLFIYTHLQQCRPQQTAGR